MNVFSFVIFLFVGLATCHSVPNDEQVQAISEKNSVENTIYKPERCSQLKSVDSTIACVTMNTLGKLQEVTAQENIEILPGISLSSEISMTERRESSRQRTINVPVNTEERLTRIFDMMYNIMDNLFSGRTLKIKMSENTTDNVMRSLEEGRGKMKKLVGPLMMALGAKMLAVLPIMIGGLALFASKALIISKLALILALILGLQYLSSNGGSGFFSRFGQNAWNNFNAGGQNSYGYGTYGGGYGGYAPNWNQGWSGTTSQNYPYARSLQDDAQDLAYSSHTNNNSN